MSAGTSAVTSTGLTFIVPPGSAATAPPESAGRERDDVRLLVGRHRDRPQVEHRPFRDLASALDHGDVLVVNTSATVGAAVRGTDGHSTRSGHVLVHVSTELDDAQWVVEIRTAANDGPDLTRRRGDRITLPGGVVLTLRAAYPSGTDTPRLWTAEVTPRTSRVDYLWAFGRPITYEYVTRRFPLSAYQTIFATDPGSAEMPSAGRPFTERGVVDLATHGITLAPLTLHCGVSSPDAHEVPSPERFSVPADTARLVNSARDAGRRIVAVGTSAVRALETATGPDGVVRESSGWTDLVLGPDRPARTVNGLVTGLHMPEASHLRLLEAVAGHGLVAAAYDASVSARYRWHEFGDSNLFLP